MSEEGDPRRMISTGKSYHSDFFTAGEGSTCNKLMCMSFGSML